MVLNQSSKERKWGLYSLINQMAYYIGGLNILQMNVRMGQWQKAKEQSINQ